MWGRRGWHWICGIALVPTATLMLASLDTAAGAGALTWAAVFSVTYLAFLLVTFLLAILGAVCVAVVGELIEDLFLDED